MTTKKYSIKPGTGCAVFRLKDNPAFLRENMNPHTTRTKLEFEVSDCEADPTGNLSPSTRGAAGLAADGFFVFAKENGNKEMWIIVVHHAGVKVTAG